MWRGSTGKDILLWVLFLFLFSQAWGTFVRLKGNRDFYFNKKVRNCWRLKKSSGNVGTTLLLAFLLLCVLPTSFGIRVPEQRHGSIESLCQLICSHLDISTSSDILPKCLPRWFWLYRQFSPHLNFCFLHFQGQHLHF